MVLLRRVHVCRFVVREGAYIRLKNAMTMILAHKSAVTERYADVLRARLRYPLLQQ